MYKKLKMDCTFPFLWKVQMLEKCFLIRMLISSSGSKKFSWSCFKLFSLIELFCVSKKNQHSFQIKLFYIKRTIDNCHRFGFFSWGLLYDFCKNKIIVSQNQTVKIDLPCETSTEFSAGIFDEFSGKVSVCD